MSGMRRLLLVVIAACGGAQPGPPPAVAPPPPPVVSAPVARACGAGKGEASPDPVVGVPAAWRVPLGGGTGELLLDIVDGLAVVRWQGGRSVAVDAKTGGICAVLVRAPHEAGGAATIDPYTAHGGIAHGLLIGGERFSIAAVDLATGALRWKRQVLDPAEHDDYALRDGLQVADAPGVVVLGYVVRHHDAAAWWFEHLVVGVDPATGAERWRTVMAVQPRGASKDESMLVVGNGARVLVRMPTGLSALDAATGARRWTVPWPAAKAHPLVAAEGGVVAVASGDRVKLVDAATGAAAGEVALAGAVTALVVRGGVVVAAVEAQPGAASVVAIDARARRATWTRPVAYSVQRLRADDELAYVLDGNGRLTALARSDGGVRFQVTTGAYDLAPAPDHRVVIMERELAAFDLPAGAKPTPLAAFVRWELDGRCRPSALALVDGDDRVVWQRAVPARVPGMSLGSCDDGEVREYRRRPRATGNLLYHVLGIERTPAAIVEADVTGLFVLRASDGVVLLDVPAPASGTSSVFFDQGTYDLDGACKGEVRHAQFFARCGDDAIYFNGATAILMSLVTLRVEAQTTFPTGATVRSSGVRTDITLRLGKHALTLQGMTFVE